MLRKIKGPGPLAPLGVTASAVWVSPEAKRGAEKVVTRAQRGARRLTDVVTPSEARGPEPSARSSLEIQPARIQHFTQQVQLPLGRWFYLM
jgi:hypothetical protein